MKKFIPIAAVLLILATLGYFVLNEPSKKAEENIKTIKLTEFNRVKSCARIPTFLYKLGIKRPIIDLSQMRYKGIAFYFGPNFNKVLHKKEWEAFDALGTYTIDRYGNIYLTPNPFISIKPTTFNLQKAIYKLDSQSGKLTRWLVIDDVKPNATNPYGLISIVYDCDSNNLFTSSIDQSNYKEQKGRIYKINPKTKEVQRLVKGFDALTINILHSKSGKFLIAGSARDNGVYAFAFNKDKLEPKAIKLFELPNPNLRVRKIKVLGKNQLKLEAIKFNYSLIAETNKKQRVEYIATYNPKNSTWQIVAK